VTPASTAVTLCVCVCVCVCVCDFLLVCVCGLQEEVLALRKEGSGVVLDSQLPHLIGIDKDLLSTGVIIYHLKVSATTLCTRPMGLKVEFGNRINN